MAFIRHQNEKPVFADERKATRTCVELIGALEDTDPTVRRWAARDLVECPDAAPALAARLVVERDLSVREVIFSTLVEMGVPSSIDTLIECLRSDDASLRNEAVEAMKQLPDVVAPFMSRLLADPDPDTRIFSVNVLESLRHPNVEAWLIDVVTGDPHVNVCGTAVDLLAEVGTENAAEAIDALKARFPDEPYIQFSADIAMNRIRKGS
jgi:HEAT repeat protein